MTGALGGRVAIVTGGGWNIGRATSVAFARAGAAVVVAGRRSEPLEETVGLIEAAGGRGLAVPTDVTDWAATEALVARATEHFGPVDVLAALAGGGGGYEPVDAIEPEWWEHVIRINLVGTFHAVRAVLPGMRAANRGSIVTCTGGGAWFPMVGVHATAYATAKAGICRFTDQLAVELMDTPIRVNCLQPGLTWDEKKLAAVAAEEARTGQPDPARAENHPPEDGAELALFLASDASLPLHGRSVSVDEDWWQDAGRRERVQADLHSCCLRRMEPLA